MANRVDLWITACDYLREILPSAKDEIIKSYVKGENIEFRFPDEEYVQQTITMMEVEFDHLGIKYTTDRENRKIDVFITEDSKKSEYKY